MKGEERKDCRAHPVHLHQDQMIVILQIDGMMLSRSWAESDNGVGDGVDDHVSIQLVVVPDRGADGKLA